MIKYILKQPRDPKHFRQEPHFMWWRILECDGSVSKGRCIALIQDEKQAGIICSMLNYRQDARARLDLEEEP